MKTDLMRFKWLANGCRNWNDVIRVLIAKKEEIESLKDMGCKIKQNNDDDYIFYTIPNSQIKEYCAYMGIKEEDLEEFNNA